MPNRLAGETSPYLLQHADNPVDWQPWGEQALTLARESGKPILLSIGYSACHWCHVMAHESFEDPEIAAVMNELFVNIKVDREERPDLDQIYQSAYQLLTGRAGGWPLTMFLTPDGTPFYGGTYFPDTPRHGLPAFVALCRDVAEAHRHKPGDIAEQNRELKRLLNATVPRAGLKVSRGESTPQVARDALMRQYDVRWGGFGGAPKFPHTSDLAFLMRRTGDAHAREAVLTTLKRMAEGGLFDQLGGGFFRYSVDERWEIPHFEKMLYDNGPLLGLYAEAWALSGDPLFARVVAETADWAIREMQLPAGGFASSLDADSEHEEGHYYVWDRDEIRALLDDAEWRVASHHWGLDGAPNFEGEHWHLRMARPLAPGDEHVLCDLRAKLRTSRDRRVHPGRDDKVLTSWNAVMIEGLARAGRICSRPDWVAAARRALEFLRTTLWREGRLAATFRNGRAHLAGYLDDYALLLLAVQEMMLASPHAGDADFARQLGDALLEHFEDKQDGGFFFTAHDHETLIHRPKPVHDNNLPGGNAAAALALLKLGGKRYFDAATRTLQLFESQADGGGMATWHFALERSQMAPVCTDEGCPVPGILQAG